MRICMSPARSELAEPRHRALFITTVSLTQLGCGLDTNGSHLHCQLIETKSRWVTTFPCLLIMAYMQLKAQFSSSLSV